MIIKTPFKDIEMKYDIPVYPMKLDFTPGTFSEDEWQKGESACVERNYYRLPNGSEWAMYKFSTRTPTGNKRVRWEVWHNGRFHNNYFNNSYEEVVESMGYEIAFNGFDKNRSKYRLN